MTQLISGGLGGYVVIGRSDNGQPEEILVMDAPAKENAVNVIRLNKNGSGFSSSGYDGIYQNAWTIDGQLVADFITTGTMLCERLKGGILTLGGISNQNGIFKILDGEGNQIGIWDSAGISLTSGKLPDTERRTYDPSTVILSPAQAAALIISGKSKMISTGSVRTCTANIGYEEIELIYSVEDPTKGSYTDTAVYSGGGVDFESELDGEIYQAYMNASDFSVYYGYFENGLSVDGNLDVGGEKNRIVQTENYGKIKMAAYETAEPMFGDVGTGIIGEDGKCYIFHDCVLLETVNTDCDYQVFLQKYGTGDVWVSERTPAFFIVAGTPGLPFGWEIKAKQRGYEQARLDERLERIQKEKTNYTAEGAAHVESNMEGLFL